MMQIIFVHPLNNYSGSPKMLSIIAREFTTRGYPVSIITSNGPGFLSDIPNIKFISNHYKWHTSKWKTLIRLGYHQIWLFFKILSFPRKNTVFYINTVTPIGAAWACKLSSKKMIYHIHEDMCQHRFLFGLYRFTYKYCNTHSLFVSQYLQNRTPGCKSYRTIYNALDVDFIQIAKQNRGNVHTRKSDILMIASLRRYKGVYEFVELSKLLPQYHFTLVLSTTLSEVRRFEEEIQSPSNLTIYSMQTNLHPFYQRARLVLQLSHPDKWIETFGLTILEAMTYGIPVIGPNVGGPVELIDNGVNGYTIEPQNKIIIKQKIEKLMTDHTLYQQFAQAAQDKASLFDPNIMCSQIEQYINE